MKIKIKLILIIFLITLSSCKVKSSREKYKSYFDLSNQLNFIKSNIINSSNNHFSVNILYGHNSIIKLKSDLEVTQDSVKIKTISELNKKTIIDTVFWISKGKFLDEIDYQKLYAKDVVVFAGHYQNIVISRKEKLIQFPTTRIAKYLIEFLEKGKLHIAENSINNK